MVIGKIYVFKDQVRHKTIYRLEVHGSGDFMFWYKNKFGEGYTWKSVQDFDRMKVAPKIYQVLYGQS